MTETDDSRGDPFSAINASQGMAHINRSHHRTFSLNIFRMNAQELIEIARRVNDPDEGLRLMFLKNRDAGQQTHREVTRRVHNFVAAALTLVEHTRIFMREHYGEARVFKQYQTKIDEEFARDPLVKFVQDLRNFMLHNGLPNSEMYLNFQSNPNLPEGGMMQTGIHIRAAPLLEWDNWTAPARRFIESVGEFVDIRNFSEAYTEKVVALHSWLQGELDQFHQSDLEELRALQDSMTQHENSTVQRPPPSGDAIEAQGNADLSEQEFTFTSDRGALLDTAALSIFSKIRQIDLPPQRGDGFTSQRPPGATITDKEIIGAPTVWCDDTSGRRVFVFAYRDGGTFGIDEDVFSEIETLTDSVLKSAWARRMLSRTFLQKTAVEWLQARFSSADAMGLSDALAKTSRDSVRNFFLWAPVAHLEVQTSFAMGPAEIVTVTKSMIDALEAEALSNSPRQRSNITLLFDRLRERMQGLAAVVFKLEGESEKVKEDGEAIARIAVGLLRFFSPAAANFPIVCVSALLGAEVVPSSNLLVFGEGRFNYSESMLFANTPIDWRISEAALRRMQPAIEIVGTLVRPEGLSDFALAVRSSLLLFGTGTTFQSPAERLTYTLSSLEALLLRHSAEPVEFNVGERMGLLLAQDDTDPEYVSRNVREAYRLRARQDISPITPREMGSVATFISNAYRVIGIALGNADGFQTVKEFVNSVEDLKARQDGA